MYLHESTPPSLPQATGAEDQLVHNVKYAGHPGPLAPYRRPQPEARDHTRKYVIRMPTSTIRLSRRARPRPRTRTTQHMYDVGESPGSVRVFVLHARRPMGCNLQHQGSTVARHSPPPCLTVRLNSASLKLATVEIWRITNLL